MSSRHAKHRFQHTKPEPVVVLVDMDGVVADFEKYLLELFRARYPDLPYIPLEDRRGLYANRQYEKLGTQDKILALINEPKFFRNFPPIPEAIDAVKEMAALDGVEVFFCTSQMSTSNFCATDKLDWIAEHYGKSWTKQVILTQDKTLVQGNILIDDKPNIRGLKAKPKWRQVLFTACHNTDFDIKECANISVRLNGWADRATLMKEIEQARQSCDS